MKVFARQCRFNFVEGIHLGYTAGGMFYAFASSIDPDYGYDLVTQYGIPDLSEFGPVDGALTGTGYVDDPGFYDIGYWDCSSACVFIGNC